MFATPTLLVAHLAETLTKITLEQFFQSYHANFTPDQDISFMEYFLSLIDQDDEFCIPHQKLREYGVMTSTQSSDVLKKLRKLEMVEGRDYSLRDMSEQESQHGGGNAKHYTLTPSAFKRCLVNARRYPGQAVDPIIYFNYYELLEKVHKYFTKYQVAYSAKMLTLKDGEIGNLTTELHDFKEEARRFAKEARDRDEEARKRDEAARKFAEAQSTEIAGLKIYAMDTNHQMHRLHDKIDSLFDFIGAFAKTTLHTWVGSSVFRAQLEHLINAHDLNYALRHLKLMFIVGFHSDEGQLIVYFCCTNFADVGARIKKLYERHIGMTMLRAETVCLISGEINCEIASLSGRGMDIFPENTTALFDRIRKCFTLAAGESPVDMFDKCVTNARMKNFQGYQTRREMAIAEEGGLDSRVAGILTKYDQLFFGRTLPMCQEFIDCYITEREHGYVYSAASRRTTARSEFGDERMTDATYPLMRLNQYVSGANDTELISATIKEKVLDRKNAKGLFRLSKAAAKSENVPLSAETLERIREVEALPSTDDSGETDGSYDSDSSE